MTEGILEIQEALIAVLTWAVTGIGRWLLPKQWAALDSEKVKLAIVSIVAVAFAVGAGLVQGLGAWPIIQLAVSALAGSVLLRRVTKSRPESPELARARAELARDRGVRTRTPEPMP